MEKEEKEIPVYEHVGPNECLIISKTEDELIVACNKDGEIKIIKNFNTQEEKKIEDINQKVTMKGGKFT